MEIITADEKSRLEEKLAERRSQRPVISQRIAEARALGDLKENAEYHAARDEQGLNEAEIRRLEERLRTAQVADNAEVPDDMVFIGAIVLIKDVDSGEEEKVKLVGEVSGSFDFDAEEIEVTVGSPMGEALMKARVGDVVRVDQPRGTRRYEVMELL